MKQSENAAPGGRKRFIALAAMLLVAAVIAGYFTAPEDTRLPVLLANGEVIMQPCYVAVDGKCVAIVKNRETAERVVEQVEAKYTNEATTESDIEEETTIEKMELKNGDRKPEILTADEASKQIVDRQSVTVKTKEVIDEEETVAYKIIEKETASLNLGEEQIQQQGQEGLQKVTKEITKENGRTVEEEVLNTLTIRESIPEIVLKGTAGLAMPLDTVCLTSPFGYRWGRQHEGIDLALPEGSPIYAAKAGIVTWAGYTEGYGNLVKLNHGEGMETYYAHCSSISVAVDQQVETGQQIAEVGSTGNSTGPHLHFEVRIDGTAQNPADWLPEL